MFFCELQTGLSFRSLPNSFLGERNFSLDENELLAQSCEKIKNR